jgi:hypothetical protein
MPADTAAALLRMFPKVTDSNTRHMPGTIVLCR